MRSLRLIIIILFSALPLIIAVTREPTCALAFLPQQPAVSGGRTLRPAGVSALRTIADSARNENLRWTDFAPYKTEFSKFYEANGYSLAWLQNGQVRPQGLAVIEVLENASSRGLEPEDYDASRWPMRLSKLRQSPSEQDLVLFDTALTVSAMRYIRAVHVGRVNPKEFNFHLDNGEGQFRFAAHGVTLSCLVAGHYPRNRPDERSGDREPVENEPRVRSRSFYAELCDVIVSIVTKTLKHCLTDTIRTSHLSQKTRFAKWGHGLIAKITD
jgi:hypothetical protein